MDDNKLRRVSGLLSDYHAGNQDDPTVIFDALLELVNLGYDVEPDGSATVYEL
jgi:hypothetical protein